LQHPLLTPIRKWLQPLKCSRCARTAARSDEKGGNTRGRLSTQRGATERAAPARSHGRRRRRRGRHAHEAHHPHGWRGRWGHACHAAHPESACRRDRNGGAGHANGRPRVRRPRTQSHIWTAIGAAQGDFSKEPPRNQRNDRTHIIGGGGGGGMPIMPIGGGGGGGGIPKPPMPGGGGGGGIGGGAP
jgi:hypothetical protein